MTPVPHLLSFRSLYTFCFKTKHINQMYWPHNMHRTGPQKALELLNQIHRVIACQLARWVMFLNLRKIGGFSMPRVALLTVSRPSHLKPLILQNRCENPLVVFKTTFLVLSSPLTHGSTFNSSMRFFAYLVKHSSKPSIHVFSSVHRVLHATPSGLYSVSKSADLSWACSSICYSLKLGILSLVACLKCVDLSWACFVAFASFLP